jgi:hypothetical protein
VTRNDGTNKARSKSSTLHTLKSLNKVADDFGNSWTSTLYRTVEILDVPSFAIIGSHPVRKNSEEKTRHFITSVPFDALFPSFGEAEALKVIRSYCSYSTRGPLGECAFPLVDVRGERWEFMIESFALPYGDVLTLAILLKKLPIQIVVPGEEKAINSAGLGLGPLQWISFGGDNVIAENVRDEQRKFIKYNHLVANILAFHNIVSMTKAIDRLKAEGQEIADEVLAAVSPYQTSHINRFGQYQLHAPAGSRSTTVPPQAPKRRNQQGGFARSDRCRLIQ